MNAVDQTAEAGELRGQSMQGLLLVGAGVRFAVAISLSVALWAGYFWTTGAFATP
ncbi:MAG: hypothetical protein AAF458_14555 [Pseudomonadota bacterium]